MVLHTPYTCLCQLAALELLRHRGSRAGWLKRRAVTVVNRSRDVVGISSCKQIWPSRSRQRTVKFQPSSRTNSCEARTSRCKDCQVWAFLNARSANNKYAAICDRINTNDSVSAPSSKSNHLFATIIHNYTRVKRQYYIRSQ